MLKTNPENPITAKFLHECFVYDDQSGDLYWKERPLNHFQNKGLMDAWNRRWASKQVCSKDSDGYFRVKLLGRRFFVHRIIWKMWHGEWPKEFIDHIDRDKKNNKINNLREADVFLNARNKDKKKTNNTGYKGVYRHKAGGYQASIGVLGKERKLGYFKSAIDANAAYQAALLALTLGVVGAP
jgi:hypothetical protein